VLWCSLVEGCVLLGRLHSLPAKQARQAQTTWQFSGTLPQVIPQTAIIKFQVGGLLGNLTVPCHTFFLLKNEVGYCEVLFRSFHLMKSELSH
jgi:hypothetical protein